jgi:hypothetical protein
LDEGLEEVEKKKINPMKESLKSIREKINVFGIYQ